MPQAFSFVVVVWGERYTRVFAELCLPTLLAPGNLPGLRSLKQSCFEIYTTREDELWLAQTPALKAVQGLLEVKFIHTETQPDLSKYDRMNACHRLAMQNAQRNKRAAVILSPDCLFSANCLTRAEKILDEGAQAIALPGLVGLWEAIEPAAAAEIRGGVLNLPERKLMELALPRLHPSQADCLVDAPSFTHWPVTYLWKIPDEGMLARYFHLHPLVVRAKAGAPLPVVSVDFNYLEHACDYDRLHVVQDSDEMAVVSLCPAADNQRRDTGRPLDVDTAAAAIAEHVTPLHERYCRLNLRLHHAECRAQNWAKAEAEADKLIAAVLASRSRYLSDSAWAAKMDRRRKRLRLLAKVRRLPARILGSR